MFRLFIPKQQVMLKPNAEHMSPTGRLPFLVCGKQLVSEVEPIIDFVNTRYQTRIATVLIFMCCVGANQFSISIAFYFVVRITGTHLSAELTGEQLADMKAYLNLTEMVLSNAELYITWAGIYVRNVVMIDANF